MAEKWKKCAKRINQCHWVSLPTYPLNENKDESPMLSDTDSVGERNSCDGKSFSSLDRFAGPHCPCPVCHQVFKVSSDMEVHENMENELDTNEEIFKEGRQFLDKNRDYLERKILSIDAENCYRDHKWNEKGTDIHKCRGHGSHVSTPRTFFQANDTSDLRLSVEGKPLYVSRILLSIVSPVLKDIFDKRAKEQAIVEIPLPGKKYSEILEFLECIYPDRLKPITGENVNLMLQLANEYHVVSLRDRCMTFLMSELQSKSITSDRIIEIFQISSQYDLQELHKMCLELSSRTSTESLENVKGFWDLPDDVTSSIFYQRLKLFEEAGMKIRKRVREAETHCGLYHKNERWGDSLCNKCLAGVGKVSSHEMGKLF